MKGKLLLLAACSCALLCSCGKLGNVEDIEKKSVSETEQLITEDITVTEESTTTTTTTSKTSASTTTKATTESSKSSTTTTAKTTTAKTTTTKATTKLAQVTYTTPVSYVAAPSDPNVGYGNDYSYNNEEPQVTEQPVITEAPQPVITTSIETQAPEPVVSVDETLVCVVKIEQLFDCLKGTDPEEDESSAAESLNVEESSSADENSEGTDEGSEGDSSSQAEPVEENKEYTPFYVAESYEDFGGYMRYFYNKATAAKYLEIYNEEFFEDSVLILNTAEQNEGSSLNMRLVSVIRNNDSGITTVTVEKNELEDPESVTSTVFVQLAVKKEQYDAHENKGLDWKENIIPLPPKYRYPMAAARLDYIGWDLRTAFNNAASIPYYGHTWDMPQDDKTSTEWYAEYGFTYGRGNCYVMAAMFCEMARTLGYECYHISGQVPLAAGGYGPHSWCEIVINGYTYICDPDFTNETGRNGYLIYYGQSGTWRYNKISVIS